MKHLIVLVMGLLTGTIAFGQNFPKSMKQPKPVEMNKQHRKFQRESKRHRHSIHHDDALITTRRRH